MLPKCSRSYHVPKLEDNLHHSITNTNSLIRWVVYTSGLAYITLPDDTETSVMVSGGEFGIIFAADTTDVSEKGHRTQYPGMTETTALEIPTSDGKIPEHRLLHTGPCSTSEITGIREPSL